MLETPLYGKFANEDRILVFSAPIAYHALIRACVGGGAAASLYGLLATLLGFETPFYPTWWLFTGAAVALAGVLASLSLVLIRFDLRTGIYRRRDGSRGYGRSSQGPVADLDALVLIAEPNSRIMAGGVTYHLVLHWKGARDTPMVVQADTRLMLPGAPLNAAAQPLRERGLKYAQALRVPFYDNAHFASPRPIR